MTSINIEDPISLFQDWMREAEDAEPAEANAMTLATSTPDGVPSARMVLLKGVDEAGFVFYTNTGSRKAEEMYANPQAVLCFHWKSLRRQVRIEFWQEQPFRLHDREVCNLSPDGWTRKKLYP